jgi:hypothetical protein
VSDQEGKNLFITVEDEKSGNWILPDLVTGDVVEWTFHVLRICPKVGDAATHFILSSVVDNYYPTLRASTTFTAPAAEPIRFLVRNAEAQERRTEEDGRVSTTFALDRQVAVRGTGFPFENALLNPFVVCVSDGNDWAGVAREALKTNFGALDVEDPLPEPLSSLLDGSGGERAGLERAFYWVRDKLKYASTRSGARRIGRTGRAKEIVDAGVGNCNDKSYLLSLVCRRLSLQSEFLAVSAKHGALIDEAPADQFDHVFVRARLDGEWLYLDAATSYSTFGSPPTWWQGMRALVLDDSGTIATLPTDDPAFNQIHVTETFDACHEAHLHGRFRLDARGHSARAADELWKQLSISTLDPRQAGQDALRQFLPSSMLFEHTRESDTSMSSRFQVSGRHARGPLVTLGSRRVGILSWQAPYLQVDRWLARRTDQLFAADIPMTILLEIAIEGELRRRLRDLSRVDSHEDSVTSVIEELIENDDAVILRRRATVKEKFVRPPQAQLVHAGLVRIERALQVVLAFDECADAVPNH